MFFHLYLREKLPLNFLLCTALMIFSYQGYVGFIVGVTVYCFSHSFSVLMLGKCLYKIGMFLPRMIGRTDHGSCLDLKRERERILLLYFLWYF